MFYKELKKSMRLALRTAAVFSLSRATCSEKLIFSIIDAIIL
jgi:hypothetical protein